MQTEDESEGTAIEADAEETKEERTVLALSQEQAHTIHAQKLTQWRLAKLNQEWEKLQKQVHKNRLTNISAALEAEASQPETVHNNADSEEEKSDDANSDSTPIQRNTICLADQALEGWAHKMVFWKWHPMPEPFVVI